MKNLPTICWLLLTVVCAVACNKKNSPATARSDIPGSATAVDPHAAVDLPAACDEYRRNLLRCMESDRFPKWAKEGQRSALEQMLSMARQEQSRKDDPKAAAAVATNCRDSLATLLESGKESCPGVL